MSRIPKSILCPLMPCLLMLCLLILGLSTIGPGGPAAARAQAPEAPPAPETPEAPEAGPGIAELGWLTGCWASVGREPGSGEQWMPPAGGTMVGASRIVEGGQTVAWEYLRIVTTENGLAYVALPSGQAETVFPLDSLEVRDGIPEVVFANPEHDFPQQIRYRLEGDRLDARIVGTIRGQERAVDFPMVRIDCEAPLG